jgi:hypothetical protein
MAEAIPLKLSLELDLGVEPITGRLLGADGTSLAFIGWLELTQLLETAWQRGSAPQEATPP